MTDPNTVVEIVQVPINRAAAHATDDGFTRLVHRRPPGSRTRLGRLGSTVKRDRVIKRQETLLNELDRFRTQQLELLGLLAAVLAFVVSASSIAAQTRETGDGVRLICN